MNKMQIDYIELKKLKPYENNPRNNDSAVEYVANSIKEFGFKVPIVIDKDYVIVAGHTRYRAAEKLGIDSVPCIKADDLSPEQVKAYRLADNKVSEFATWDFEKLNLELDNIDFEMKEFGFYNGFDESEFDGMFDSEAKEHKEKEKEWKCVFYAETEQQAEDVRILLKENGFNAKVES